MARDMDYFLSNDTATTEIYTLSLHDALPISTATRVGPSWWARDTRSLQPAHGPASRLTCSAAVPVIIAVPASAQPTAAKCRSEEHTSELQSRHHHGCRLLLDTRNDKIANAVV